MYKFQAQHRRGCRTATSAMCVHYIDSRGDAFAMRLSPPLTVFPCTAPPLQVSDAFAKRLSAAASAAEAAEAARVEAEARSEALAAEAETARGKLREVEASSAALQGANAELRGSYERDVSAAKKEVSELETLLKEAKQDGEAAERSVGEGKDWGDGTRYRGLRGASGRPSRTERPRRGQWGGGGAELSVGGDVLERQG